MPTVEFVGQSSQDADNLTANTSRLLNLYREPVQAGGKTRFILKSVLGQSAFVDLQTVFMRSLEWIDNRVYSAAGGNLYEVSSLGGAVDRGPIEDSTQTTMTGNNGLVTVCAGGKYYVLAGGLVEPTGQAFDDFGSVEYLGGYTLLTERDGRRFQWSSIADPEAFNALDFAVAEGADDKIIRGVAANGYYLVFKERTIEVWYQTGQASASAFARTSGAIMETGLKAFGLVAKIGNGLFFVGDDNIVYITTGDQPQPISTTAVTTSMATENPQRCFYYEDEGHKFCVVQFTGRPAWCYDLATGEWHERSERADHGPWTAVNAVNGYGEWLCGSDSGEIYKMSRTNVDLDGALHRRAVSRTVTNQGDRFKVKRLEFFARVGMSELGGALTYVLGASGGWALQFGTVLIDLGHEDANPRPAKMWLRTSGDGGHTFSHERPKELGSLGEYETRAVYRSLGQFRQLTVEINITDRTEIPVYADAVAEWT